MKKLFLLLLTFAILFSAMTYQVSADTYEEAGEFLTKLSIIKGDGSGDLKPHQHLTREESVAILLRMLNEEQNAQNFTATADFKDIPMNHWAAKYVTYAKSKGLTTGTGADTFGAGQEITAKQFVTFMLRALNHSADWASEDIMRKADKLGLLDDAKVAENLPIKRGDVFIIMKNTLETKINNTEQLLLDSIKKGTGTVVQTPAPTTPQMPGNPQGGKPGIVINASYANIEFVLSEGTSEIRVDPNGGDYFIQSKDMSDGDKSINIIGKNTTSKSDLSSRPTIKIYVPTTVWDEVEFNLLQTKLKADKVFKSGDITCSVTDSDLYIELLDEFKGEIEINATNQVLVDLISQDKFKDGTFAINSLGVVNLPEKPQNDNTPNRNFVRVELNLGSKTVVNVK